MNRARRRQSARQSPSRAARRETVFAQIQIVVNETGELHRLWDSNTHMPLASSQELEAAANDHLRRISELGQRFWQADLAAHQQALRDEQTWPRPPDSPPIPDPQPRRWWFIITATTYGYCDEASLEWPSNRALTVRQALQHPDTKRRPMPNRKAVPDLRWENRGIPLCLPTQQANWSSFVVREPRPINSSGGAWRPVSPKANRRWIDLLRPADPKLIHLLHYLLDLGFLELQEDSEGAVRLHATKLSEAFPATNQFVARQEWIFATGWRDARRRLLARPNIGPPSDSDEPNRPNRP